MNLENLINFFNNDNDNNEFAKHTKCITAHYKIPEKKADYAEFPSYLDLNIQNALIKSGIRKLYTHQAKALDTATSNNNLVCVTPTSSGKSLCYLLPILQNKIQNKNARSLLLFPTKALSQDQQENINKLSEACNLNIGTYTFDGDTEPNARKRIREAGDLIITNPDMLHSGILPHHTTWVKLFENLKFIVIDELHVYRGVFGSHVANVLRRLLRICKHYNSYPQILACSATIANPVEHAERLTSKKFILINNNGAPQSPKNIIFYNPPVIQTALNIRKSAIDASSELATIFIKNKISSIIFCRSRLRVELLFTSLIKKCVEYAQKIKAYRGGYLPNERREIEKQLRDGELLSVVSTNALELGIDIGSLDIVICVGYPGSLNSLLQQFGRAGRREKEALAILVASSLGTDQYIIQNPAYFFEKHSESVLCNPHNLLIVSDHLKCAAFELPFSENEFFEDYKDTQELLNYFTEHKILYKEKNKYFWLEDIYPASTFSLRTGPKENFVIIDTTTPSKENVIGKIDIFSAPTMIHKDAIYIHQGVQFYVQELLWKERQARVKKINVDYYTDAEEKVEISILEAEKILINPKSNFEYYRGELNLRIKAILFKKLKLETNENIGWGEIDTPELEMHTQATWLLIPDNHPIHEVINKNDLGPCLQGVAWALGLVSPLFVLCDNKDINFRAQTLTKTFNLPSIFCYDNFAGGLELSNRIFMQIEEVAVMAKDMIKLCKCKNGCPSCTGLSETESDIKKLAVSFLDFIT